MNRAATKGGKDHKDRKCDMNHLVPPTFMSFIIQRRVPSGTLIG